MTQLLFPHISRMTSTSSINWPLTSLIALMFRLVPSAVGSSWSASPNESKRFSGHVYSYNEYIKFLNKRNQVMSQKIDKFSYKVLVFHDVHLNFLKSFGVRVEGSYRIALVLRIMFQGQNLNRKKYVDFWIFCKKNIRNSIFLLKPKLFKI